MAEASRQLHLTPVEIKWEAEDRKCGMENAWRAKSEDVREQSERQLRDMQEAYVEAMLETRAPSLLGKGDGSCSRFSRVRRAKASPC